jgi:hypothetical protein
MNILKSFYLNLTTLRKIENFNVKYFYLWFFNVFFMEILLPNLVIFSPF